MDTEKVVFGFFIVLATTLNFGFFSGEIDIPSHHEAYELLAALVVSLIATALKLSDRSQIGAVFLATSLVADLQLGTAAVVWGYASHTLTTTLDAETMATVVSLAGGALFANLVSTILLIVEIVIQRR